MNDIVQASTAEEARARAERIRSGMRVLAEWQSDVIAAYAARDWDALGYDTWDAYLDGEYGEHRVRLPRDQRREIVASMSAAGMSTRAIGAAVGTSYKTVQRDVEATGTNVPVDEGRTVLSLDGRERPATRPAPDPNVWIEPTEVVDAELVGRSTGRTYSPAPVPQRAVTRPRVDVPRIVLVALSELRQVRDAFQGLTPEQLARQDEETRRIWAARLTDDLEALHGFLDSLTKENNQ